MIRGLELSVPPTYLGQEEGNPTGDWALGKTLLEQDLESFQVSEHRDTLEGATPRQDKEALCPTPPQTLSYASLPLDCSWVISLLINQ